MAAILAPEGTSLVTWLSAITALFPLPLFDYPDFSVLSVLRAGRLEAFLVARIDLQPRLELFRKLASVTVLKIPVSKMPSQDDESRERPLKEIQEQDELVPRKQAARIYLRQHFVRCMKGLMGHAATFHMHERTTVTGTFRGCDIDVENFAVSQLLTAMGCQPAATLRASDVISITFNDIGAPSEPCGSAK